MNENLILSADSVTISVGNNQGSLKSYASSFPVQRTYSSTANAILVTVPSTLYDKKFTQVSITSTLTKNDGGTAWRYTTDAQILELLNNGATSFNISFIYAPNADTGTVNSYEEAMVYIAAGAHYKTAIWNNISVAVEYEDASSTTSFGSATCFTEQTSYAKTESLIVSLDFMPSNNIGANNGKILFFSEEADIEFEQTLNTTELTANTLYNFNITQSLSSIVDAAFPITDLKIKIWDSTDLDPTKYLELPLNIKLVQQRIAPSVTVALNKTTFLTNVDKPVITLTNYTTDSNTDASIQSIQWKFANDVFQPQTLNFNSSASTDIIELPSFLSSADILNLSNQLVVVDSYNQSTTINLSSINIYVYIPPAFSDDFYIKRYIYNTLTSTNEITDEGVNALINGSVIFSSQVTTKSVVLEFNNESITLVSPYTYSDDTTIFSNKTFDADITYTIRVIAQDNYSSTILDIDLPAATGYFNIEEGGVAVGGFAHGTPAEPQFECYYPMYLYFKDSQNQNVKYEITLGAGGVLTAVPVGGYTPTPTPTRLLVLYDSTGNLSYDSSAPSLTYTDGNDSYTWTRYLNNLNTSATLSLNNQLVITAGGSNTTTYNNNLAIANGITVPSTATKLKISYSVTKPSGATVYLYYGLISTGFSGSSPVYNVEQDVKCIKTVALNNAGTATDTFDIGSYSWLLGQTYIPIVMFNARSNSAYASFTLNKLWFDE